MSAVSSSDEASSLQDRQLIRELIENWVVWRDAGDWDRLATLWLPDGHMNTTWLEATASEFIARSRRAWDQGLKVLHSQGGSSLEVRGARAIAQTKVQITQRDAVHDVLVDVICQGRFWDALEKRDGRWGLLFRQPIYELDRMATVNPGTTITLDEAKLSNYPEGYRHLAYLQNTLGLSVVKGLPGTRGPEIEALQASGRKWLGGAETSACFG